MAKGELIRLQLKIVLSRVRRCGGFCGFHVDDGDGPIWELLDAVDGTPDHDREAAFFGGRECDGRELLAVENPSTFERDVANVIGERVNHCPRRGEPLLA